MNNVRRIGIAVLAAAAVLPAIETPTASASGRTNLCARADYGCVAETGYSGVSRFGYPGPHNCILFAATRLSQNGYANPAGLGNAVNWDESARARGVRVDREPAVGAIGQIDAGAGHVFYVDAVSADSILISEDNWGGGTAKARIDRGSAYWNSIEFLHFKNVVPPAPAPAPVAAGSARLQVVAAPADTPYAGTLAAYALSGNHVQTAWQSTPGGGWNPFATIGGDAPGPLNSLQVVVAPPRTPFAGTQSAYAVSGNRLYTTWQSEPGGRWAALAEIGGGAPGALGSLQVLAAPTATPYAGTLSAYTTVGNRIYTTWQSEAGGRWHPFSAIGGDAPGAISSLAVVAAPAGTPYAGTLSAYAAVGGRIYTTWQSEPGGPWHSFTEIGGGAPGAITALDVIAAPARTPYAGAQSLYAVVGDRVLTTWQTQPGGAWQALSVIGGSAPGGVTSMDVVAAPEGTPYGGTLSAYLAVGDRIFTTWQSGPGGSWYALSEIGGPAPGALDSLQTVVSPPGTPFSGAISAYALTGNRLVSTWQSRAGGAWAPLSALGGSLS